MLPVDTIFALLTIVLAFAALRWFEYRIGHRLGERAQVRYVEKIDQLEKEIAQQRERHRHELKELQERIDFLLGELHKSGAKMRALETKISRMESNNTRRRAAGTAKPLLLICGDNEGFCEMDRQTLRRAGISFHRLSHASKRSIDEELRRRRQDGTLYRWIHVAAHADNQGIYLGDEICEPTWWHDRLDDIEVIFLAACSTATVADTLAGLTTVVYVQEDVESGDVSDFAYAFWRRVKDGIGAYDAYSQALSEVPQVGEFVDIRKS